MNVAPEAVTGAAGSGQDRETTDRFGRPAAG